MGVCKTPLTSFSQIPTRGGRRLRRTLSTSSSDAGVNARPRSGSRAGDSYGIFSLNKDRFKDYDLSLPTLATTNGMIARSISGMKDAILSGRKSRPESFVERDDTAATSTVEEHTAYVAPSIRSALSSTKISNTFQASFNGVFQQQSQLPEPSFDAFHPPRAATDNETSENSGPMLRRVESLNVESPGAPKNARSSRRSSLIKAFGFTNINVLRRRERVGPPGLIIEDDPLCSRPLSLQSNMSGHDGKRR